MSGRPFGTLLCCAAALLTLGGSFQALCSVTYRLPVGPFGNAQIAYSVTSWERRVDAGEEFIGVGFDDTPPNGAPLTVAAVVLLVAAVLRLIGAARITRLCGPAAAIGAAFLTGTVWTIGMQVLAWLRIADAPGAVEVSAEASVGAGFWQLVAAVALAIAGVLLSWRRVPVSAVREEPDTPVLGIPVVIRLPDEPPPDR